jgi:hypothetical protein
VSWSARQPLLRLIVAAVSKLRTICAVRFAALPAAAAPPVRMSRLAAGVVRAAGGCVGAEVLARVADYAGVMVFAVISVERAARITRALAAAAPVQALTVFVVVGGAALPCTPASC